MKESIGVSPDQLLFGNAIRLNQSLYLPKTDIPADARVRLSQWASTRLFAQERMLTLAQQTQRSRDDAHVAKSVRTNSPTQVYADGSLVLMEYQGNAIRNGPPNKFLTQLRGPMQVISHVGDEYTLLNLVTNKDQKAHIKWLRPFLHDHRTQPRDVARRDLLSSFEVESIQEHKGTPARRRDMEFRVRWTGYGEADDLWLPYSEIRNIPVCHDYFLARKLKVLIPREFRTGRYA